MRGRRPGGAGGFGGGLAPGVGGVALGVLLVVGWPTGVRCFCGGVVIRGGGCGGVRGGGVFGAVRPQVRLGGGWVLAVGAFGVAATAGSGARRAPGGCCGCCGRSPGEAAARSATAWSVGRGFREGWGGLRGRVMGRGRVRWTAGCGLPVGGVGAVAVVAGCGGPLGVVAGVAAIGAVCRVVCRGFVAVVWWGGLAGVGCRGGCRVGCRGVVVVSWWWVMGWRGVAERFF